MSLGLELKAAKRQDSRMVPRGSLQLLSFPSHRAEGHHNLVNIGKRRTQQCFPLSNSYTGFHTQEKQKATALYPWFDKGRFGETRLHLKSPLLTGKSNPKASRTAPTILHSYFTGIAFRQEAMAMAGVTAR